MDYRKEIALALEKAIKVKSVSIDGILSLLEVPPDFSLGDYAFPCFHLAKELKKSPKDIALGLQKKISKPRFIEKIEAVNSYINFFLDYGVIAKDLLPFILKEKKGFGKNDSLKGKKVMIEFISPNPNKPLHVGHVRNACIGSSASSILQENGAKVIQANLINDRGIHICKAMLAYKRWGKNQEPEGLKLKPDHFVGYYYTLFEKKAAEQESLEQEAQDMLRSWEEGDEETILLWKKLVSWALEGFEDTFKLLGIDFNELFFESLHYKQAKPLIEEAFKKKVFFKADDGTIMAGLEAHGLPNKVILRADGTSIYIANDLALTPFKFDEFKLDESIWVVGNDQSLYFKQLFKIFELVGFAWAKQCRHLSYGMVYLPSGKMSSRAGTVVNADDLIKELTGLAEKEILSRHKDLSDEEVKQRSEAIALAALKFFMLKIDSLKDFTFNKSEAMSFEGETGPYLQYSLARIHGILLKARDEGIDLSGKADLSCLKEASEKKLIKMLLGYPELIQELSGNFQIHKLCHYLISLSQEFNSFYHDLSVLKAEPGVRAARLQLIQAIAVVLENAFSLLGIKPLKRM